MGGYIIEDVPLPLHQCARYRGLGPERLAVKGLKVGQSFTYPPLADKKVANAIQAEKKDNPSAKFTMKTGRCYRIA